MKIAIYGDSFANHCLENLPGDLRDRSLAWTEWLAQSYQVTNFAVAGSSLFYSYNLFLENNKNFDYNIFLATETNRITLPEESIINSPTLGRHINLALIDALMRFNDTDKTLVSAINLYYGLIHNQQAVDTFHNLMIENIVRINQKTLVIPSFQNSLPDNTINNLLNISGEELVKNDMWIILQENNYFCWNPIKDETGIWTFADYRKCHLNEKNNKILADIIDKAIKNNQQAIDLSLSQFTKSDKDLEHYYYYIDLTSGYNEGTLNGRLYNLCNKLLIDTN